MMFTGQKDIKWHVEKLLRKRAGWLKGKSVIDLPAGSGHSSSILQELGAQVRPFDLFPEFFRAPGLTCQKWDLAGPRPSAEPADCILFQEGIEHLSDQLKALRDLNASLKPGGLLFVTTPNYSNLRSRLSYFLNESEYFRFMPPNEIESIWMTADKGPDIYFGHIFNLGIQKLRIQARLSGFEVINVHTTKACGTALLLFTFCYPFILFTNLHAYWRAHRKNSSVPEKTKTQVFREQLRFGINPAILCSGHLILELRKQCEVEQVKANLTGKMKTFLEAT